MENIYEAILTKKIPENTRLRLVYPLRIFPAEMTSFMLLLQYRDTRGLCYLL